MTGNGTINWIPDGYTQAVYFRELPGVHGDFRMRFRPLLIMQQAEIDRELQNADYEKRQWIAARWISSQVVDWSLKKPGGETVSTTDVNDILRIRSTLFNRMWNAINNQDGGDVDPDASEFENYSRSQREQAVASAEKKQTVQEVMEGN